MTSESAILNPGMQRTRRNIMKMGAILVPATLGTVHSAAAGQGGNNQGGNNQGGNNQGGNNQGGNNQGGNSQGGNSQGAHNCFLKGTKIRTAEGERGIEDLAIGDLLPTMSGVLRPVQWIGRYSFKKSDPSKAWAKEALPVRIARSALAPHVPHADLYLTALHGV